MYVYLWLAVRIGISSEQVVIGLIKFSMESMLFSLSDFIVIFDGRMQRYICP